MFPTLKNNVTTNVSFNAIKRKDTFELLRFFTAIDAIQTRKILSRRGVSYRPNELKEVANLIDNGEVEDFKIKDFLKQFRVNKSNIKRLQTIKLK